MSWLFSRALVEAFSGDTSLDGEPSAPLSVVPTQHKFWRLDKTMEPSRLSRFGLTCAVLTADRGEELLTWFRAGFPARTSAQLEPVLESTASAADSGLTSLASLVRFDPNSRSWKTPQCSLLGDSDEFLETWPRWGSMRSGVCWARTMPALPTSASESGSWATPTVSDALRHGRITPNMTGISLAQQVNTPARWPTPRSQDGIHSGRTVTATTTRRLEAGQANLAEAVLHFPTPTVCGNYNRKGASPNSGDGLETFVKKFPTPAARDFKHPNSKPYSERGGGSKGEQLPNAVGGALNPPWVEWLMGWPIGWTEFTPLETARFQQWPHSHSKPSTAA